MEVGIPPLFSNVSLADDRDYACQVLNHEYMLRVSVLGARPASSAIGGSVEASTESNGSGRRPNVPGGSMLWMSEGVARLAYILILQFMLGVLLAVGDVIWK